MAEREYVLVGQVITADQLTDLAEGAIITYDSLAAARAASPQPPLRSVAWLTAQQQLAVRLTIAGSTDWQLLSEPDRTTLPTPDVVPGRVPPADLDWHNPVGAVSLPEVVAAVQAGRWQTSTTALNLTGHLFDEGWWLYDPLQADTIIRVLSGCWLEMAAIGGGGSGAPMVFTATRQAYGATYRTHPVGGGGGGGGEVVPVRIRVEAGDELIISVGQGGLPTDHDLGPNGINPDLTTAGGGGAGGSTTITLDGQVIAAAGGGSGGRHAGRPATSQLTTGSALHTGYGLGSGGGGGIVSADLSELLRSHTPEPPTGWQQLSALPPVGWHRRGGDGAELPEVLPEDDEWHAYAGSGGGGVDAAGQPQHGRDGDYRVAGFRSLPNGYTRGWFDPIQDAVTHTGIGEVACGGGGGTASHTSGRPSNFLTALPGRRPTAIGCGSGGGGVWSQPFGPNHPGPHSDRSVVVSPLRGTDGAVLIRHRERGLPPVVVLTSMADYDPRQLTNTPPVQPSLSQSGLAADGAVSGDEELTITVAHSDLDPGDVPSGWTLRRRIDAGSWQYLQQGTDDRATSDVWLPTQTDATIRRAAAGQPIGLSYTLRPGWDGGQPQPGTTITFSAQTRDQSGHISPWAELPAITTRSAIRVTPGTLSIGITGGTYGPLDSPVQLPVEGLPASLPALPAGREYYLTFLVIPDSASVVAAGGTLQSSGLIPGGRYLFVAHQPALSGSTHTVTVTLSAPDFATRQLTISVPMA